MFSGVFDFWFSEIEQSKWFIKDAKFDGLIKSRFLDVHTAAKNGELYTWRKTPKGRLAEIIVLDQFSRNMFRDTPSAFATDALALVLAQEALASHVDEQLPVEQRNFFYMPFMHSESKVIHEAAVEIFENKSNAGTLKFELRHKEIIDEFGRYPHRNNILGRVSTQAELKFLTVAGSGF